MARAALAAARAAALLLAAAGMAGALASLLELGAVFPGHPLASVPLAGGAAAALAGVLLWLALRVAGGKHPARRGGAVRITASAAAVALGGCIAAALGGYMLMKHATQEMLFAGLAQDFRDRAALIRNEVGERLADGELLATRPNVHRLLARAHHPREEAAARAELQQVAASFIPFEFIAITFLAPDGRELARDGAPVMAPALRVAVPGRDGTFIAWNAGYELEQRIEVRHAGRHLGSIALRQPLREFRAEAQGPLRDMMTGVCAAAGASIYCFPGRGAPLPRARPLAETTPQMKRALAGESGVLRGPDFLGNDVIAAFGPLADLGLGMVVRVPTSEVLAPLRAPLVWLPVLVAALAAAVTGLLLAIIAPLVRRLDRRERQLHLALDASALALWDWRVRSDEVFLSEHWQAMLGGRARPETMKHADLAQLVHPEDLPAVRLAQRAALKGEAPHYDVEHRVRALDGSWIWIRSRGEVVERDARGRALRFVGTNAMITERKERELAARHAAMHDPLTGLPNRVLFHDRLEQALEQARRKAWVAGVLYLDLDGFKHVNDTLGHAAGDALLKEVAARLSRAVRGSDTAARIGGDEFAAVLSELARADDAVPVAEKILAAMAAPMSLEGYEYVVTVSIGIALFPRDGADAETLVRNADEAMFRAKQAGRNAFRLHQAARTP